MTKKRIEERLIEQGAIAHVGRRAVLRGAFGATLALPFLELFASRASAQARGTHLVITYAGQAMGSDGDDAPHTFAPSEVGNLRDITLPLSLLPLGGTTTWSGRFVDSNGNEAMEPMHALAAARTPDVRSEVTVISGLHLPEGAGVAAAESAAHRGTVSPLLSGTRSSGQSAVCNGETADVVADRVLSGGRRVLRCTAQAANYGNGGGQDMYMSYRSGGMANPGLDSPRTLFEGTFGPGVGLEAAAAARARRRRSLVLDIVRPSRDRLVSSLGTADRARLERHFDLLADVDRRLDELDASSGGCESPASPPADPPIGGPGVPRSGRGGREFDDGEGYSNELLRAEVFADIVALAFACDLSRVATLMYSYHQSFMSSAPLIGIRGDVHELSHGLAQANGRNSGAVGLAHHYPVRSFAYLVSRLRDLTGPAGTPLLDSTAMVLLFEAGHSSRGSHTGENMAALVAGGAGGLARGRHLRYDREHPARVLSTLLGCVGAEPRLGELSGSLPGLAGT